MAEELKFRCGDKETASDVADALRVMADQIESDLIAVNGFTIGIALKPGEFEQTVVTLLYSPKRAASLLPRSAPLPDMLKQCDR